MKKLICALLFVVFLFALLLELTGSDPNKNWTFRGYVAYVTENIEPLPKVQLKCETSSFTDFLEWLYNLIAYPVELVLVALKNVCVLFYGLLPFELDFGNGYKPNFAPVDGPGIGGGGGGAR